MACENSRCVAKGTEDDDSACTADEEADTCGLFRSAFCTGDPDQAGPECPEMCRSDDDCDTRATCKDGDCIALGSLQNGDDCTANMECRSKHCSNGVCCTNGDCCTRPAQCAPAQYTTEATCAHPQTCQGTRGQATCVRNTCEMKLVDDDSACSAGVIAKHCAEGADLNL